jgi:hypothetical protein
METACKSAGFSFRSLSIWRTRRLAGGERAAQALDLGVMVTPRQPRLDGSPRRRLARKQGRSYSKKCAICVKSVLDYGSNFVS